MPKNLSILASTLVFSRLICITLVIAQITPSLASAIETSRHTQLKVNRLPAQQETQTISTFTQEVLEKLGNSPSRKLIHDTIYSNVPLEKLNLNFKTDDPVLDRDPYFIRAQSWNISGQDYLQKIDTELDTKFIYNLESDTKEVRVQLKNKKIQAELSIQEPLKPVLETQSYLFFVPQTKDYFKNKTAGEGLFFIPKRELQQALQLRQATPVYFFPMPDGDWHNIQDIFEMEASQAIYVRDGNSVAQYISYVDIDLIAKAQRNNFMLCLVHALKNKLISNQTKNEIESKLIAAISSFSATSSLVDLLPKLDVTPLPFSTAGFGTLLLLANKNRAPANDDNKKYTPEQLKQLKEQREKLIERITWVCVVLSAALTISIALRYIKYREHFVKKRFDQGITDVQKLNAFQKTKLYTTEILDVFVHSLTTLAQIPTLTAGHLIMNATDRYFPKQFASENLWIRKIMNRTVLMSVRSQSRVPVNANTFYKGVVILGGIDTAFVYVQLYDVVPWTANHIATALPSLKGRVNEAFSVGDPLIEEFNRNEVIRNGFAYSTSGAMSVSSDLRSKIYQIAEGDVEKELKREGYNLADASTQELKQKRIDEIAKEQMKRVGLPGVEEYLFDYRIIIESAYKLLGYRELTNTETEHYAGQSRPGLWRPALRQAIARLKKESNESSEAREALLILMQAQGEMSFLENLIFGLEQNTKNKNLPLPTVQKFKTTIKAVQQARKRLLALTYEGDWDEVKNLPEEWTTFFSEPGAKRAAKEFRKSFFGYLGEKEPDVALPDGRFTKWQKNRAQTQANQKYVQKYGFEFIESASDSQLKEWRDYYKTAMIDVLGLHPDYDINTDLKSQVVQASEQAADSKVKSDDFQLSLKNKNFIETQKAIADVYVETEISEYIKKTVWSSGVSRLDPAQPGVTQKIRQKSFFRGDHTLAKLGTRALRFVDAWFAEAEYVPGLASSIYRYVPTAFDLWQGITRSIRNAPLSLTAVFLWQRYFWGADLSWANWVYFTLFTSFTISGPAMTVSRIFENQSWRPVRSVFLMALLATAHSWTTFWGSVPSYIFARDFNEHFLNIMTTTGVVIGSQLAYEHYQKTRELKKQKQLKAAQGDGGVPKPKSNWVERCKQLFSKSI